LIAAVSEIALFILSNIFILKYGFFDLISLSIQGLRICILVILLSFYIAVRNPKGFEDDEERQSLLLENYKANSASNGNANGNGTSCGATTNPSEISNDNSSDSDEEDIYSKQHNKALERVQKRLETDGN
jgi:hypothetical protein